MDIIVPRNRVGAAVGYRRIFVKNYVYVDPTVDMHFFSDKLAFSFDVPLNIEIFDGYIKKDDAKGERSASKRRTTAPRRLERVARLF
jgi:hypothetical protein